jgi:acetyl esterase/lipase
LFISGGNFAAVVAMRFATQPVGNHSPRLQILIYPVLQFFDMMLPSYIPKHYQIFHYTVDHTLSVYLNETIDKAIYANKHTTVEQKKHYRQYIDWSLLPSEYRTIYKHPITDDNEGDPNLIERAKKALNPEVSPLLVEDKQLVKLPLTYILSVGHDRLRDDAFIYEGRLKRVGVPVIHNHYEHTFHGSLGFSDGPITLDVARQMTIDLVGYIKKNL